MGSLGETHTFELKRRLPACVVDKEVLVQLEEYLLDQAERTFGIPKNEASEQFSVVIEEAIGTERLASVHQYGSEKFADATISIRLAINVWDPRVKLNLYFHRDRNFSLLEAATDGPGARGKTIAFDVGVRRILESRLSTAWFLHPPTLVGAALFGMTVSTVPLISLAFMLPRPGTISALSVTVPLTLVTYHVAAFLKPYTAFASRRAELRQKGLSWFVAGMVGFIVFSTIMATLRKRLFGF